MPETSDKILGAFARLYYYVPTFAKPLKVMVSGKSISISEPKDAILWLCELLMESTEHGYCRLRDVKILVVRWYPTARANFSTILTELEDQDGCIQRVLEKDVSDPKPAGDKRDNRMKWITLTPVGHKVLERIKARRRSDLRLLLTMLHRREPTLRKQMLDDLEAIGRVAWLAMLKKIKKKAPTKRPPK